MPVVRFGTDLPPIVPGSYANGKWSAMASMHHNRIYFSTQMLQNGKVYSAGGEWGSGGNSAELYDPLADTWTLIPGIDSGNNLADANSQILPDGSVLQNIVGSELGYGFKNIIYKPGTNSFNAAPPCLGSDEEATWLKLPDYSIFIRKHRQHKHRALHSIAQCLDTGCKHAGFPIRYFWLRNRTRFDVCPMDGPSFWAQMVKQPIIRQVAIHLLVSGH